MGSCTAEGEQAGEMNADPLCPGQVCAAFGPNEEMLDGVCTIDCSDGRHRCPQGTACLQLSVNGQAANWLCTAPCTLPQHCRNGLSCVKSDPAADEGYCFATLVE